MEEKPVDVIVRVMNEMYHKDCLATTALLAQAVPCNSELAEHPDITVRMVQGPVSVAYTVDLLGVLAGIVRQFEPETRLVALFSDTQGLLGFARKLKETVKAERYGQ
jgi:hypothetical protein